jgi:predicted phospho-2-dehydro-3-deoxyheptonate aldolase
MYGKEFRLARLIGPESQRTCLVPIDHGTTLGPIPGLEDYLNVVQQLVNGGADGVILHKGLLKKISKYPDLAKGRFLVHLSVSTVLSHDASRKVLVCTVEEAIKLGADGISVHVNLGAAFETEMIRKLGDVSKACLEWGMPLLAMMYSHKTPKETFHIEHAARLGEELGADLVKVDYPGSIESMEKLVNGVHIPVLIAGGASMNNPMQFLSMINDALLGGAAGVSIGRNIFQNENPELLTSIISDLVHGRLSYEGCLNLLADKDKVAI